MYRSNWENTRVSSLYLGHKRNEILARFDDFSEVLLDFKDVPEIGQAFADEIFRVFGIAHPNITLMAINESPHVAKAIASAAYRASSPKPAS